jgi:hypothetical protein
VRINNRMLRELDNATFNVFKLDRTMSGICSYRIIDNPFYQELFLYGENEEWDKYTRRVIDRCFYKKEEY